MVQETTERSTYGFRIPSLRYNWGRVKNLTGKVNRVLVMKLASINDDLELTNSLSRERDPLVLNKTQKEAECRKEKKSRQGNLLSQKNGSKDKATSTFSLYNLRSSIFKNICKNIIRIRVA